MTPNQHIEAAETLLTGACQQIDPTTWRAADQSIILAQIAEFYRDWHQAEPAQGHDVSAREWQAKADALQSGNSSPNR